MFALELTAMYVEGPREYFSSGWNYIDILTLPIYITYVVMTIMSKPLDEELYSDTEMIIRLLRAANLIAIALKISYFQKISESLGLMQQLLMGVMSAVIPFMVIYLGWVCIFALMTVTLGANHSNADAYTDLFPAVGYFLTTFENSLGNINNPSINFMKGKTKLTVL